ncbi:mycothiol synthase [Nocardioides marmorisolisilvae]|uniref:Mycothiol acetyltransferase n=1 Tax=Nocardioides marmorisolisilvae TaxID=1542737 RepID=A0A3N0DPF3_9ACTN|nr:mycothiol synthase [Nocardioides marmorisolisilvae]RNL77514.1 mycothiol synthase [Nocardioides marmorisolisilvae]
MSINRIDPDTFFDDQGGSAPADEVRRIAEACDVADGVITLNEQACLQLKYRGLRDAALWLGDDGFALLHGQILDIAVHPMARNRGTGSELARLALAEAASTVGKIEAWSHGDHPSAGRIASKLGIHKERELRIMARPTSEPVVPIDPPAGVKIRSFTPADETGVLEVNAAAFSHHPEQGHMTHEDFLERSKEAWFDADGLFLAVPDDEDPANPEILGFHWTKVHLDENPPYGEVYVVATNPKAVGRGLGSVLTNVGLSHLATKGVGEVILYVDGDNAPAIAVYERQGFTTVRTEVQYRGAVG